MNDIEKAIRHFKNMKEKNYVVLDGFKKEIEMKKAIGNDNINYNTSVYENRDKYYSLAIQALEKQLNGGWISCKDKLPEIATRYIIALADGTIDIDYFYTHDNEWQNHHICYIKAWQPLPEPYNQHKSK